MKVGLVLSGGAARGIAHLGVLQALDELEVEIDALSGTSSGAIVAAFYASGVAPQQVLEMVKRTKLLKFMRPAMSKTGLLKVQKLQDLFGNYLPVSSFQDLNKQLTINATDIKRGETKYFQQGELIPAILASCCMPVIFDPMVIDGESYMDGGILNNLPVEPLVTDCQFIIGSHCNPVNPEFKVRNAKALLERTLLMAIRNNVLLRKDRCHFYIEPPELGEFIGSDFDKAQRLFEIGYHFLISQREDLFKALDR